jgi:hypothetical protein
MVRRFSSRQGRPYRDYLNTQLEGAYVIKILMIND